MSNEKSEVTEEINQEKREYFRNWRRNNPDKVKAAQERYWQRKLAARSEERHQTCDSEFDLQTN